MEGKTCLCQPCVPVGSETSACLVFLESSSRAAPLQGSWPGWGRPQGRWHCVPGPFVTVGTVGRNVAVCHRALCNTPGHSRLGAAGHSVQRRQWDRVVLQGGPVQPPCSLLSPDLNHFFFHVPLGTDIGGTGERPSSMAWRRRRMQNLTSH